MARSQHARYTAAEKYERAATRRQRPIEKRTAVALRRQIEVDRFDIEDLPYKLKGGKR